jgi:hypothetical protein
MTILYTHLLSISVSAVSDSHVHPMSHNNPSASADENLNPGADDNDGGGGGNVAEDHDDGGGDQHQHHQHHQDDPLPEVEDEDGSGEAGGQSLASNPVDEQESEGVISLISVWPIFIFDGQKKCQFFVTECRGNSNSYIGAVSSYPIFQLKYDSKHTKN